MNRRDFSRNMANAALGAAAVQGRSPLAGAAPAPPGKAGRIPYKLSVMLWTVFQKLPFEQRLEKVAEAGYHAVELVGEFHNWSADDYRSYNRKKRALGMNF